MALNQTDVYALMQQLQRMGVMAVPGQGNGNGNGNGKGSCGPCSGVSDWATACLTNAGCADPKICDRVLMGLSVKAGDPATTGAVPASGLVPAGDTVTVSFKPKRAVNIENLRIGSEVARYWRVIDIKIGAASVLPSQEREIPGSMLSEVAVDAFWKSAVLNSTNGIDLILRNADTAAQPCPIGAWVRDVMISC